MSTDRTLLTAFYLVFGFFGLILAILFVAIGPLRSKAASNELTVQIKIQGNHKYQDKLPVNIAFYNGPSKVSEEPNIEFSYETNGVFTGHVPLKSDFNFSQPYALFIKPYKYAGRLFCLEKVTGITCTVPAFRFLASGSTINLTDSIFYGGDIPPANGKIDAQDISEIMKNLGKISEQDKLPTDINYDGITDVVDYSLVFYALSQNWTDDVINLSVPPTLIPTLSPTPTPTGAPTATPAPTLTLAPTVTKTPTATPKPTEIIKPSPTASPSATPKPTAKPSPTPTVKPCLPKIEKACLAKKEICVNNKCVAAPTPTLIPTNGPTPTPTTGAKDNTCKVIIADEPEIVYYVADKKTTACLCKNMFGSIECLKYSCTTCTGAMCSCKVNTLTNEPTTYACTNNGYLMTEPCSQ